MNNINSMNNKGQAVVIGIFIVLILIAGFFLLSFYNSGDVSQKSVGSTIVENTNDNVNVKTFVLTGENFKFIMNDIDNPEIRVNEGDKVRIEFTSTSGFHDWTIDEFNAATERVNAGGSTFVEFIADKKGTFEYYCSVGEHRAMGMKGNLVIN